MITVKPYNKELLADWSKVVSEATNSHFFFHREYLEYHSDRFKDASLIFYLKENPIAVLPCSVNDDNIISHGGLTFGGLVFNKQVKSLDVVEIFTLALKHFSDLNFNSFTYKVIPDFYQLSPCTYDQWALTKLGAELSDIKLGFVIDNQYPVKKQSRRIRSYKKGVKNNYCIKESDDYEQYWEQILIKLLKEKYGVQPVHNVKEINYLKNKFPENIKLYIVEKNKQLLAGTVIFETHNAVHTQYIGASEQGKATGAQDLLYHSLITEIYNKKKYFSFGTAEGNDVLGMQNGLVEWKEGFGARGYPHYIYSMDLSKFIDII